MKRNESIPKTPAILAGKVKRAAGLSVCAAAAFLVSLITTAGVVSAKKVHTVFFEGTNHELHVYRSFGDESGKTLLLIGGIQGDEPGGFLSADHYADISLLRGNLIVVPRANFHSILLKRRQVNDDMNRKFGEDGRKNYEAEVVAILKELIAESDMLLNLHDGSGFYAEEWEGPERNPMRFGQSIIADSAVYKPPGRGEPLYLEKMARRVIENVNRHIRNSEHHFHFNNHRTNDQASLHKEQRKSATYYALYKCGIPAFGVETSKSLPLVDKIRHHNLAINAFMEMLNIVPETPGIRLDHPELRYLIVSVNDSLPILVENQQTLFVKPNDTVMVSHIEANYERGLSADIVDLGSINDLRKKIRIEKPTRIVIRKDYYPCGSVYLALSEDAGKFAHGVSVAGGSGIAPQYLFFRVKINGKERLLANYDHLRLVRGDQFVIEDLITSMGDPSSFTVNFKGFVGDKANNTGEDRGYVIDTARDLWDRFSEDGNGRKYPVVVSRDSRAVGKLVVELDEPTLGWVVLKTGDRNLNCYASGDTALLDHSRSAQLMDIITNVERNSGIKAFIKGPGISKQEIDVKGRISPDRLGVSTGRACSEKYRMEIQRNNVVIGSVFFTFFPGDAS